MPQLTWRWAPGWEGRLETRSHLISLFVTHIQAWLGENKEGEVCVMLEEWSLGFTIKKEESLKARIGGIQCLAARQIFLCPKWRSLFLTRKLLLLVRTLGCSVLAVSWLHAPVLPALEKPRPARGACRIPEPLSQPCELVSKLEIETRGAQRGPCS